MHVYRASIIPISLVRLGAVMQSTKLGITVSNPPRSMTSRVWLYLCEVHATISVRLAPGFVRERHICSDLSNVDKEKHVTRTYPAVSLTKFPYVLMFTKRRQARELHVFLVHITRVTFTQIQPHCSALLSSIMAAVRYESIVHCVLR